MTDIRDYIRPLFALLADGKITEFTRAGSETLRVIGEDVADLENQAAIIRKAMTRHGIASAIQPTLALQTEKQPPSPTTRIDESQRRAIRETAIELAMQRESREVLSSEVVQSLQRKGVRLSVGKPTAVVASILFHWKGFSKIEGGKYKYSETS